LRPAYAGAVVELISAQPVKPLPEANIPLFLQTCLDQPVSINSS
jgi:hypothetical protein